jgi:hypothetical protein
VKRPEVCFALLAEFRETLDKATVCVADFNEDVAIVDEMCEMALLNDTVGSDLTGIRVYSYCSMVVVRYKSLMSARVVRILGRRQLLDR